MTYDKTGGPAFPAQPKYERPGGDYIVHDQGGMTLRQYAAIKLRVPDSGTGWLDDMIRQAKRDDFAGQADEGPHQ
jgi:hypothetical protein